MLVTHADLSGLYGPTRFGVSPSEWEAAARRAVANAESWMRRYVPLATLNEARANLLAGGGDTVDEMLRQAEYYYAAASLVEEFASRSGGGAVRVGDISFNASGETETVRQLKQRALSALRRAGFWGEIVAGV